MTATKIEMARESLDAWRRADVERLLEVTAPDFEFVPLIAAAVEGGAASARGPDALKRFFDDLADTWETFDVEPGEFNEVGGHVLARNHVRAKGRSSGLDLDQPLFTCFWFEGDEIVKVQSYFALDAAQAALSEGARK